MMCLKDEFAITDDEVEHARNEMVWKVGFCSSYLGGRLFFRRRVWFESYRIS